MPSYGDRGRSVDGCSCEGLLQGSRVWATTSAGVTVYSRSKGESGSELSEMGRSAQAMLSEEPKHGHRYHMVSPS